jgi:hypothetical protein
MVIGESAPFDFQQAIDDAMSARTTVIILDSTEYGVNLRVEDGGYSDGKVSTAKRLLDRIGAKRTSSSALVKEY